MSSDASHARDESVAARLCSEASSDFAFFHPQSAAQLSCRQRPAASARRSGCVRTEIVNEIQCPAKLPSGAIEQFGRRLEITAMEQ
jgi:hypothetical protein